MKRTYALILILMTLSGGLFSQINGTYVIGGAGADYPSIASAVSDLVSSGINAPVTFNINTGTYNEQITFPEISGAGPTNTITFKSATGNPDDVIWQFTGTSADNFTLKLLGGDYYHFRNMTIKNLDSTYGRVIELMAGASHNLFEGNKIFSGGSSSFTTSCVYDGNTLNHYNTYLNNYLSGGFFSMYILGIGPTSWQKGTVIRGNEITGSYRHPIYLYHGDSVEIEDNYIHSGAGPFSYGISAFFINNHYRITGNRVNIVGASSVYNYGIHHAYGNHALHNPNPTGFGLVANNMISIQGGTGTNHGLHTSYGNGTKIYYNTVLITGGSIYSRALDQANASSNTLGQTFKNNIFINTGGGYAAYFTSPAQVASADHNVYYTSGAVLALWSANRVDLQALQTAGNQDSNSISILPAFISNTDLHLTSAATYQLGTPVTSVTIDIEGQTRHALTPCIGADEVTLVDAGVSAMTEPIAACPGLTPVKVKIKNYGIQSFNGVTVNWSVNGIAQSPYNLASALAPFAEIEVILGSFHFLEGIPYDLAFFTSNPNNANDQNLANDTLSIIGFETSPTPVSSISAQGSLTVCDGEEVVLHTGVGTGLSYLWLLNGNLITGATDTVFIANQPGDYELVTINSLGCVDTSSVTTVIHNPLPLSTIASGGNQFCQGDTLLFTANGGLGLSHQWFRNGVLIPGAVSSQYGATLEGQYHVKVYDLNACENGSDTMDLHYYIPYEGEEICAVTLDPVTGKNLIVWEKAMGERIMQYNVYREGFVTGQYNLIGTVPYNAFSTFIDSTGNPLQQAYRYTISILDSCGSESSRSPYHKTIHLTSNVGPNGEINLLWTAYEGAPYLTHNILRSTSGSPFIQIGQVAGNMYSYTDLNPPVGQNQYYVEIELDGGCFPAFAKSGDFSSIRSNMVLMNIIGINDLLPDPEVRIFPNPSQGRFSLVLPLAFQHKDYTLEVHDHTGKRILEEILPMEVREHNLSLPEVSPGLYYLRILGVNWSERILIMQ
jgi:hypothetical protein